jgi:hypothetical protein
MERKQLVLVVLFVVLVAGALWLRHYFSPGQVVRRQLAAMVASFEEEQILGVMSRISRSYRDPWAGDYESLAGIVQSMMDAYDELDVDLLVTEIDVDGEEARLGLKFVIHGKGEGSSGAILGKTLEPCTATIRWVKEQPGWRLTETVELDIPEYRDELEARRRN